MLCEPRETPGPHEGLYFIYLLRWSSSSVFKLCIIEFQASQNSYKNDNLVPSNKKENRNSVKKEERKKNKPSYNYPTGRALNVWYEWRCKGKKDLSFERQDVSGLRSPWSSAKRRWPALPSWQQGSHVGNGYRDHTITFQPYAATMTILITFKRTE